MDSLTQIVLGAAMGEAVLGKKLGNRAMVWGALGGTIPDLDIIGNLFLDEVAGLAFHRGITHSFFFAIVSSFLLAWLCQRLYKWHNKHWVEFGLGALFMSLIFTALAGITYLTSKSWLGLVIVVLIGVWGVKRQYTDLVIEKSDFEEPTYRQWHLLWFFALITHPILDSFTQYGTQLFAPFSNYRVAFSNISVADPSYTVLFLIGLITASLFHRSSNKRKVWNYVGIALSSTYMIFTIFNKFNANEIMENSIAEKGIEKFRYVTNPTILSNFLWSGTAETDSVFYQGLYSNFDKEKNFKLIEIPKNHHLISDAKSDDRTINILKWFSGGYYMMLVREDGKLQMNDMRFGTFRGEDYGEDDFIFRFILQKGEDGYYTMLNEEGGPPEGTEETMMSDLWNRVKGI